MEEKLAEGKDTSSNCPAFVRPHVTMTLSLLSMTSDVAFLVSCQLPIPSYIILLPFVPISLFLFFSTTRTHLHYETKLKPTLNQPNYRQHVCTQR